MRYSVFFSSYFQVSGHFDYGRKMDSILEVIGVKTKQHVTPGAADSLQQWSTLCRVASSNDTDRSPDADDEIEAGVEAEFFDSADTQ